MDPHTADPQPADPHPADHPADTHPGPAHGSAASPGRFAAPYFTDRLSGDALDDALHPAVLRIAAGTERAGGLPEDLSATRAAYDRLATELAGRLLPVEVVEDHRVPVGDRHVGVKLIRPGPGLLPVVLWAHGGGFVRGSLQSHESLLRRLANDAGAVVVAPALSLAPERRWPAAADEMTAVLEWVWSVADDMELDPRRTVVGGDGSGAALAVTAVAHAVRRGATPPALQVLLHPVLDLRLESETWLRYEHGPWLHREREEAAVAAYAGGAAPADPEVSPLLGDPAGMPPAHVGVAEFDGYRDDGQSWVQRLRWAGVDAETHVYRGLVHDAVIMTGRVEPAMTMVKDACAAIRRATARRPAGRPTLFRPPPRTRPTM